MNKSFIILLLVFASCFEVSGQSDTTSRVSIKAGVYYNSYLNYYGRTNGIKSQGIFPLVELWLSNLFYANVAPVFTTGAKGLEYAGTVATAGYLKTTSQSTTNIYVSKPFYKEDGALVQSALKAQLSASATAINKIINITGGADIKFASKTDFSIYAGIDHVFKARVSPKAIIVIDPSFYAYTGTQHFDASDEPKEANPIFQLPGTISNKAASAFNILSYELSVPIIVVNGKWMFLATPAFVIPQNVKSSQPEMPAKTNNLLYVTLGTRVTL